MVSFRPGRPPGAVSSITVNELSGTTGAADHDVITLTGEGKTVAETTKNVTFNVNKTSLTLTVSAIDNPGVFSLTSHGSLNVSMDSSAWNSLSINQDGCCPALVSLTNDTSGSVTVKEGWGDNSNITLTNDKFLVTNLEQYNGTHDTTSANCNGLNDSINVTNSSMTTLNISQSRTDNTAAGANNSVNVDGVLVASTGFGVKVSQGNGNGDTATVNNVNLQAPTNKPFLAGISVTQGSGNGDTATVTNSTVSRDITVKQGSGAGDTATVDTVTSTLGGISVSQTDGKQDTATVSNSSAKLDVTVTQGDGGLDTATVLNVTAGGAISVTQGLALPTGLPPHGGDTALVSTSTAGGDVTILQKDDSTKGSSPNNKATIQDVTSTFGGISITQGSAAGDVALIDPSSAFGDVTIIQGDGAGDMATVNQVTVTGPDGGISVTQGIGAGDTGNVTNSTVNGGDVSVSQGSGNGDTALVDSVVTATGNIFVSQTDIADNTTGDTATVSNSSAVGGNITIGQGDGNGDIANVLGVIAGSVDDLGGDVAGTVTVTQGNGYNDVVNVDQGPAGPNMINNLVVTQGNNAPFDGCLPGLGDAVHVNDSNITSDITISQGTQTDGIDNAFGYYIVTIGDTSAVVAGGATLITQVGEGNTVILGGATAPGDGTGPFDFTTTWLDVFTGDGGGAFVDVTNTQVLLGSYLGNDFTIDGGGDGNTFVNEGGNDGVTISGNFNVGP